MRRLAVLAGAVGLALLCLGVSLQLVLLPAFTRALVTRVGSAELAGLSQDETLRLAEEVRAYVTRPDAPALPQELETRTGFDARQSSHLDDVAKVIVGATRLTWALALAALAWALVAWRRGGVARASLASACRGAGVAVLVAVPLLGLAGTLDFEALFARFHGLFFAAGTWQFYADDLIILLFPERFWVLAGAAWGLLAMLLGGVLLVAARLFGGSAGRAGV